MLREVVVVALWPVKAATVVTIRRAVRREVNGTIFIILFGVDAVCSGSEIKIKTKQVGRCCCHGGRWQASQLGLHYFETHAADHVQAGLTRLWVVSRELAMTVNRPCACRLPPGADASCVIFSFLVEYPRDVEDNNNPNKNDGNNKQEANSKQRKNKTNHNGQLDR